MADVRFETMHYGTEDTVLAFPEKAIAYAKTFDKTTHSALVTTVDGKSIIKAGTVYPSNDANAVGVVRYDVDVTKGAKAGAVIIFGVIRSDWAQEPDDAAKAAMAGRIMYTGDFV